MKIIKSKLIQGSEGKEEIKGYGEDSEFILRHLEEVLLIH